MKYYKHLLILIISLSLIGCKKKPEIFQKGLISTVKGFELNTSMTNDCKTIFFTITNNYHHSPFRIYMTNFKKGKWSKPELLSFSKEYSNYDPFISWDGKILYFISNMPINPGHIKNDFDMWYVEKKGETWNAPVNMGFPINSDYNQFYCSISKSGTMYFTTVRKDTRGLHDIYFSKFIDGKYTEPVNIGDNINTRVNEYDPAISPDEEFMVFSSERDLGRNRDLYITYNNEGAWTKPKLLDPEINTSATEFKPYISPDKKYLYYTSTINGRGDIYRIELKYILYK